MRNLLVLSEIRGQLSPYNSENPECRLIDFCRNAAEDQVFLLDQVGSVHLYHPTENTWENHYCDLQMILEDFDASTKVNRGYWKWISFIAELNALVCASKVGSIVTIDLNTQGVEVLWMVVSWVWHGAATRKG
jgi:hypothetical protein